MRETDPSLMVNRLVRSLPMVTSSSVSSKTVPFEGPAINVRFGFMVSSGVYHPLRFCDLSGMLDQANPFRG